MQLLKYLKNKFMVLLMISLFMTTFSLTAEASRRHKKVTNVTNVTQEVKAHDRNFYVPLEAEVNVTPQRFRSKRFQGVFSTSGVEVGGGEPVFWTGAIAKFDIFPEEEEKEI